MDGEGLVPCKCLQISISHNYIIRTVIKMLNYQSEGCEFKSSHRHCWALEESP